MMNADPFASIEDGHGLAQAIVDTIREPLLVLDRDLRVVAASRSFYLTFKVEQGAVEGRPIYSLGDGEWNIPELRLLLEEILPRHTVMDTYEVQHDFMGLGTRTMVLNARAVFNRAETLILMAIEDVTERREAQREMEDLLRQKEILLQEMQHRIANSLQIIASILLLKARTVRSEETRLHLHEAHQRVMSIASVQEQLHWSGRGDIIQLGPYLSRLCSTLATSMIGDSRPISVEVQVERGTASSTEAVSIGLIVTELLINAVKHAFVGERNAGRIVVTYEAQAPNWRLSVSDNGIGRSAEDQSARTPGLGTSIVEALAGQLDARVETIGSPDGTRVSITSGAFSDRLPLASELPQ